MEEEDTTENDIYFTELLEVRKENQVLKTQLSNISKTTELKLVSKDEELTNALIKNIKHEQDLKSLKEQLLTNIIYKLSSKNHDILNITLASKDNEIVKAHKIIDNLEQQVQALTSQLEALKALRSKKPNNVKS